MTELATKELKPICWRCQKELPEYGYCEECKDTCTVCDGTGEARGKLIIREKSTNSSSPIDLCKEVIDEGYYIHLIQSISIDNQPGVRVVGHRFLSGDKLKEF